MRFFFLDRGHEYRLLNWPTSVLLPYAADIFAWFYLPVYAARQVTSAVFWIIRRIWGARAQHFLVDVNSIPPGNAH